MGTMIQKGFAFGLAVFLWWVLSTWLMPRFAGAPTWHEDPSWYLSALMLGLALSGVVRLIGWLRHRSRARPRESL